MDPTKDNTKFRGEDNQSMRFANATLGKHRHVCAFFHGAEEEYRVLLPFVKEGLAGGEKAFHIVDRKLRDAHVQRLSSAYITGAMGTRAMIVMGGMVQENPFFVPPDEFLRELGERRAHGVN